MNLITIRVKKCMPTDDDRRSEGYKWCEILGHGWYFGTCPDCVDSPYKGSK